MGKNKLSGIIFILIGAFFFGAQGVLSVKAMSVGIGSTIEVAYLKLFYGMLATIILNIFFGKLNILTLKNIFKKENILNIVISTAGIVGVNAFIMIGYSMVGAALGIVYLYSSIFFTIFLSRFISKEKITVNKIFGGIFIIIGLIVVYAGGTASSHSSFLGVIMCLLGGVSMSFYNIFAKKNMKNFSMLNHNLIQFFLGVVVMSFMVNPLIIKTSISSSGIGWVVLLGVLVFAVAYPLFGIGLSKVESGVSGIIASSEIIYSTVLAFFIFRESLSAVQIIGIVFVMAAIIINSINFKRDKSFELVNSQEAIKVFR